MRGEISSGINNKLHVSVSWPVLDDLFQGYKLKIDGIENVYSIVSSDLEKDEIIIDGDIDEVKSTGFEVFSGEEAPVFAARLATRTALHDILPPMNMRLGSTKGTNSLLEKKGARVALLVSKGFHDIIEIGSQQRPELFALNVVKSAPLYAEVIEVNERIDADGRVIVPLDEHGVASIVSILKERNFEAVAIGLMNSYQNPEHENHLHEHLNREGFQYISVSSAIANEIGILARIQTTIVNSYLSPVIQDYLSGVRSKISIGSLKVMTSAGGLVDVGAFLPKDSLLSGPAGGVVGAARVTREHGIDKVLTFDMGGTSTDVSRYVGKHDYTFSSEINNIPIYSPALAIETVAAGGGSICSFDGYKLVVGPESAGAMPGPACYGNQGPLTITDVNLLLGRIDPSNFNIPLKREDAALAFADVRGMMPETIEDETVLEGFLQIANEIMAEAIRKISISKGYDPSEYALIAFGGAGGQHACSIADLLQINKIIIPYNAGLLSAYGIGNAEIERFANRQLLKPLKDVGFMLKSYFNEMQAEAITLLSIEGIDESNIYLRSKLVYLRFRGQENTLEINYSESLHEDFEKAYRDLYGHWITDEEIEVESIKLIVASRGRHIAEKPSASEHYIPKAQGSIHSFVGRGWRQISSYIWEELSCGAQINGPALLLSQNSTLFVDDQWALTVEKNLNAILEKPKTSKAESRQFSKIADLELFTNRFKSVADDMGAILQRTAFSVNVKDRMDYSCAVLSREGYLVANAPNIPVHLGSLGVCARHVMSTLKLEEGDVVITNHPGYGGSHLPDITLLAPVFFQGELVAIVANRAHHAELGGKTPGSMPAGATNLEEEGVVISPTFLVKNHRTTWEEIKKLLTDCRYPTRALEENLADLNGALASIKVGIEGMKMLCVKYTTAVVLKYMKHLLDYSGKALFGAFSKLNNSEWSAHEYLDDGHEINVRIIKSEKEIVFDFSGTSDVHPGNLNANLAILNSAVVYVLRLMLEEPLPLNEGIMKYVRIDVPRCMLNPDFDDDPALCPAVVGGNTETSQRIVDTLLKALKLAACSQGTMNNLIFGNQRFGFYETIGGGVGAGEGFNGADAVHQHMTNTKITDPEVLEHRYPVILEKMEIRKNSGGKGHWKGGDGIKRKMKFREDVTLTILSQHRKIAPYGMEQGNPGAVGKQVVTRANGRKVVLNGIDTIEIKKGDTITIETPGGGGYGKPES